MKFGIITQAASVYLLVGSRRANTDLESRLAQNQRSLSSAQTSLAEQAGAPAEGIYVY